MSINCELNNDRPFTDKKYDALFYSNETGFAALSSFITEMDLKKSSLFMRTLAEADREPMVAGVRFKNPKSHIKGVVIASGERSKAHQEFVRDSFSRPYRDFFYAMYYFGFKLADEFLNTNHLGVTHLTGGGEMPHYNDAVRCAADAYVHYGNQSDAELFDLTFTGCCLKEDHFEGLGDIEKEVQNDGHQEIEYSMEEKSDAIVDLEIYKPVVE